MAAPVAGVGQKLARVLVARAHDPGAPGRAHADLARAAATHSSWPSIGILVASACPTPVGRAYHHFWQGQRQAVGVSRLTAARTHLIAAVFATGDRLADECGEGKRSETALQRRRPMCALARSDAARA